MKLCDINPFLRYAELQPSVLSNAPVYCSYDYRIFYIVEGNASFVLPDRRIPISRGMLLYFRPGTPYYFDGKVKVIVLNFDMTRRQAEQKTPRTPSKSIEEFDATRIFENDPPEELSELIIVEKAFEMESRLQECLLHYNYPTSFSDAFTSAIVKDILCHTAQISLRKHRRLPEAIQKTLLYIQQNYDKEISNTQISGNLGYHSFYLNRIFKQTVGITLHQAVINERIRIAKQLLEETELSVHLIANEVGFADRARFCTAFRKQVGKTPLEYRKERK